MLGRQRRRCASSRQFEIAIGLTSRQTKFARQRHGRLRHASSVRQQPPCRSQSVGLLLSRGTNHLTQPFASQINCIPPAKANNCSFKMEVIFCVQGADSPLLANLYMRRFVLGWKMLGLEQSLGSRIV